MSSRVTCGGGGGNDSGGDDGSGNGGTTTADGSGSDHPITWGPNMDSNCISIATGDTVTFTWIGEHNVYELGLFEEFEECNTDRVYGVPGGYSAGPVEIATTVDGNVVW